VSWLTEPWSTELVARAGIELVLVGIVGGVLGVFVVVRGLPYTVEAFSHTIFPGAVLAAAFGGSIVIGGLIAGLVAAAGILLAGRSARTGDETAIGVVFTGMFAAGALLASALGPLDRDLTSFLFGSLLGVSRTDLLVSALVGAAVLAVLLVIRRPLIASSFDREAAAAAGVPTAGIDGVLLVLLALAVVVSVRSIGNVLVLAMFVTPAATARLVCRRLGATIALAACFGIAAGVGGLYVSYYGGVAAGGAVVLVATALFALTWLVSPRAGLLAMALRSRAARPVRA
jgi:manganese/iron transport system permease protein